VQSSARTSKWDFGPEQPTKHLLCFPWATETLPAPHTVLQSRKMPSTTNVTHHRTKEERKALSKPCSGRLWFAPVPHTTIRSCQHQRGRKQIPTSGVYLIKEKLPPAHRSDSRIKSRGHRDKVTDTPYHLSAHSPVLP